MSGRTSMGQPNLAASHAPRRNADARRRSSPPMTESVSASTRNCARMWCGLAPTAMRTPISRVRSVTLTSMMFMMPMPPTSSDTAAMLASSVVRVLVPSCCAPAISVRLRIEKSSSPPALDVVAVAQEVGDRRSRRASVSSAEAALTKMVPDEVFCSPP